MVRLVKRRLRDAQWLPLPFMSYGDYAQFLHRALANPDAETECPDMPGLSCGEDHDQEAIYYWEGAYYLLVYLLGWSNPAKGLHWLYGQAAAEKDNPVLHLLRSVYDNNGQLAMLAAWFWEKQITDARCIREWAYGRTDPFAWTEDVSFYPGSEWWRKFRNDYEHGKWRGWLPYGTDYSPLHLGHVLDANCRSDGEWIISEKHTRRAAFFISGSGNWYRAICASGRDLPELGERSWYVDVIHKQLGWLGSFRRSRMTGLWFQGHHSVHLQGN